MEMVGCISSRGEFGGRCISMEFLSLMKIITFYYDFLNIKLYANLNVIFLKFQPLFLSDHQNKQHNLIIYQDDIFE